MLILLLFFMVNFGKRWVNVIGEGDDGVDELSRSDRSEGSSWTSCGLSNEVEDHKSKGDFRWGEGFF